MSDITSGYLAAPPVAGRGERPKFGLVAIFVLALASAVVGIGNPAAVVAEYQIGYVR